MGWLLKKLGLALAKFIIFGEYKRIKNENKRQADYGDFMHLMGKIAELRSVRCKTDELSPECPMAMVINQMYNPDPRGTTSGTDTFRMFTIIGSDGQVINVQGFDLSQMIKITVRHTDGKMDVEDIDPSEAMKRIRREAGFS